MATLKTFDGYSLSYDLDETSLESSSSIVISANGICVTLRDEAAYKLYSFLWEERSKKVCCRKTLSEIIDLANLLKRNSLDENTYL